MPGQALNRAQSERRAADATAGNTKRGQWSGGIAGQCRLATGPQDRFTLFPQDLLRTQ
jgi:hypothetical protein